MMASISAGGCVGGSDSMNLSTHSAMKDRSPEVYRPRVDVEIWVENHNTWILRDRGREESKGGSDGRKD